MVGVGAEVGVSTAVLTAAIPAVDVAVDVVFVAVLDEPPQPAKTMTPTRIKPRRFTVSPSN
jgi:hypothetical protein